MMKNAFRVLCTAGFLAAACSETSTSGAGGSGGRSGQGGSTNSSTVTGTGGRTGSGGADMTGGSGGSSTAGSTGGHAGGSGGVQGSGGNTGRNDAGTGVGGSSVPGSEKDGSTAGSGGSAGNGGATASTGGTVGSGGSARGTGGIVGTGGATKGSGGTIAGTGGTIAGTGTGTGAAVTISPGSVWNDTQGKVIQAHGEGIIKVADTYYWLGEDKTNGAPFQNVNCYSSTDLKNWTFVNNVLTRQASGDLGPNRIIERPHVIYNASTSQFVMYMHVDNSNYTDRKAGVATSSTVCGSYTYRNSFKPLGHDSLDDTLFQDGTTGYFLSEDRTNTKLQVYQLSDDYLTVASLVTSLPQFESPAVVKIDGTYFVFGSHLTGWSTNDNQYSTATSMAGPWSSWKSFAPSGTNTCNSQVTFVLPVVGTIGTAYVFLGDRWNSNNLTDSRYIWQPLTIKGTTVSMTCPTSWTLDASAGTWR
jgi:hypothetical protein